jgi:hypothetical protein
MHTCMINDHKHGPSLRDYAFQRLQEPDRIDCESREMRPITRRLEQRVAASVSTASNAPIPEAMQKAIRDHAYYLWLSAGRPDGNELHFWVLAEQQLQSGCYSNASGYQREEMEASTSQFYPTKNTTKKTNHENKKHPPTHPDQHASELMPELPSQFCSGTGHALLQYLARIPKKRVNTPFSSRHRKRAVTPHAVLNKPFWSTLTQPAS